MRREIDFRFIKVWLVGMLAVLSFYAGVMWEIDTRFKELNKCFDVALVEVGVNPHVQLQKFYKHGVKNKELWSHVGAYHAYLREECLYRGVK